MSRTILRGLSGASPLDFMAALGLLRLLRRRGDTARLGFLPDGSCQPFIESVDGEFQQCRNPRRYLAALVACDAAMAAGVQSWSLVYEKEEKKGAKIVADLKAPPKVFASFLSACIEDWLKGDGEAVAYAAAFGTDVAVDGKGNTKPTAFHFTAANQQFLGTVESIRASVTPGWVARSLFKGHATRRGSNLRWDPVAERNWALMANNPNDDGTSVDGPLEWMAFRGLPVFPSFPCGARITTTSVSGRSDQMQMTWPLWSVPASIETAYSVLQMKWTGGSRERVMRGVFAVCSSAIRRTGQGFGNFSPATVSS